MLVICVRRKYVTLIYDLPGRGGGYYKFCLESRKLRMFQLFLLKCFWLFEFAFNRILIQKLKQSSGLEGVRGKSQK